MKAQIEEYRKKELNRQSLVEIASYATYSTLHGKRLITPGNSSKDKVMDNNKGTKTDN